MSDMVEAFGEDVDQKAPDEFVDRQVHGFVAIGAFGSIVLPGEGDGLIVDADQPAVGDGDPMGVAGEIGQHGFWTGERQGQEGRTSRRQVRLDVTIRRRPPFVPALSAADYAYD